jgi:hypothetical protein
MAQASGHLLGLDDSSMSWRSGYFSMGPSCMTLSAVRTETTATMPSLTTACVRAPHEVTRHNVPATPAAVSPSDPTLPPVVVGLTGKDTAA